MRGTLLMTATAGSWAAMRRLAVRPYASSWRMRVKNDYFSKVSSIGTDSKRSVSGSPGS
jgi:hypothetical protein